MLRSMASSQTPPTARIRILQTTDLHMHLIPFDYDTMTPATDRGLSQLRSEIARLRNEGFPTLLCDTGDFMQGGAMADVAIAADGPHPMITAFNELAYDAVALGNHDFDFGIAALRDALADLTCPALAANVDLGDDAPFIRSAVIRDIPVAGQSIKVGLMGLVTPLISQIAQDENARNVIIRPAVEVAQETAARLKKAGADVIVALCHFGIDQSGQTENVVTEIAKLPDVDAILAGHTHDVFPGHDVAKSPEIDPVNGIVHGTPTVMAGAFGRHVGLIDLDIADTATGWCIQGAEVRIVTPKPTPVPAPLNTPGILALHDATVRKLQTPIAQTSVPLTTAFSALGPDMSQQLLADARRLHIHDMLSGTSHAHLPVLASTAPYRAGNKEAPANYLSVKPGPITHNDVLGIYPFPDVVVALHQTGAQLRAWLEMSAVYFADITTGVSDQPLINRAVPPYDFKTLFGLTYNIDVSAPVGQRISALYYAGRPVAPDNPFVVATTPYRKHSSRDADILTVADQSSQDILISHLKSIGTITGHPDTVWQFTRLPQTAATFTTHETADPKDTDSKISALGPAGPGLRRFSISFD